jgi:hypothetical protein
MMGKGLQNAQNMTPEKNIRLVRVEDLAADVEVVVLREDDPLSWGPYLTPESVQKLEAVRAALRRKDIAAAQELAKRVYRLTPAAAE